MKAFTLENTEGYTEKEIKTLNDMYDYLSGSCMDDDDVQNLKERILREYDSHRSESIEIRMGFSENYSGEDKASGVDLASKLNFNYDTCYTYDDVHRAFRDSILVEVGRRVVFDYAKMIESLIPPEHNITETIAISCHDLTKLKDSCVRWWSEIKWSNHPEKEGVWLATFSGSEKELDKFLSKLDEDRNVKCFYSIIK